MRRRLTSSTGANELIENESQIAGYQRTEKWQNKQQIDGFKAATRETSSVLLGRQFLLSNNDRHYTTGSKPSSGIPQGDLGGTDSYVATICYKKVREKGIESSDVVDFLPEVPFLIGASSDTAPSLIEYSMYIPLLLLFGIFIFISIFLNLQVLGS